MESSSGCVQESELFLQWGNRKRNRSCAGANSNNNSSSKPDRSIRRITSSSNFILDSRRPFSRFFLTKHDDDIKSCSSKLRSGLPKKPSSSSPENNNHYSTRGSSVVNRTGVAFNNSIGSKKKISNNTSAPAPAPEAEAGEGIINRTGREGVWPKLHLGLSNKEKEEDFMAMKGCKPPHRPKKRPKAIQRSVLLVCPGGWLADMCKERYEVREKKSSKKRPRGLKGMGTLLETDDSEWV